MLYSFSPREIAAILSHELGHLQLKHTTYSMVVVGMTTITNLCIRLYSVIIAFFVMLGSLIPFVGIIALFIGIIFRIQMFILDFLVYFPMAVLRLFGQRCDEYEADRYACEIGLGPALYEALKHLDHFEEKGWWEELQRDHPYTIKRLRRIEEYCRQHEADRL